MNYTYSRDVLKDLKKAARYEWLEKNQKGSYACSTIIGLNTRRSHGLLVVADPYTNRKIVVLSKLEESVFIENRVYEISTNQYENNIFPHGYQYIERFESFPFLQFHYRIEDRLIRKTVLLLSDHDLLLVRYELRNQGNPIKLILKPFLVDRYFDILSSEYQGFNTDSYLGNQFVRWAPVANMPELQVHYNRGEFISATLWYHNFYYSRDEGKYDGKSLEDIFNPGFIQANLEPYQTLDLFISTEDISDIKKDFEGLYRKEHDLRKQTLYTNKFVNSRLNYLHGQIPKAICKKENNVIVESSSIEPCKDLFHVLMACPGVFFINQDYDNFRIFFRDLVAHLDNGLLPDNYPFGDADRYSRADLSLWLINLAFIYLQESNDREFFINEIYDALRSIYDAYNKGTSCNIYCTKNNLVFSGSKDQQTGWMPLVDQNQEVLRYGHLVEINALWYNAIRILETLSKRLGKKWHHSRLKKYGDRIQESFVDTFVDEHNQVLYDVVTHDDKDATFSINQLIAISLPFSPVPQKVTAQILQRVDRELLTPFGLKFKESEQEDPGHTSIHRWDKYNEGIYPGASLFYVQAAIRHKEDQQRLKKDLPNFFSPLLHLMDTGILGTLPEIVFSNHHFKQAGCEEYITGAACVLWAFHLLDSVKH
ncbi:MAG: hypothetical protein GF313_13330 [Caldithrix sp.]|nr:hypothetical protein [Caldithrix sp.]